MAKGRWAQAEGELLVALWCMLDSDGPLALLRGSRSKRFEAVKSAAMVSRHHPVACRMRDDAAQATIAKASEVQSLSHEFSSAAHLVQQVCGDGISEAGAPLRATRLLLLRLEVLERRVLSRHA
jgi:hypothetical protein